MLTYYSSLSVFCVHIRSPNLEKIVFFHQFLKYHFMSKESYFLRQSIKNTQNIIHSKGNVVWYRIRYKEPVSRWNWRPTSPCALQLAVKHYLNHNPLEKKKTKLLCQASLIWFQAIDILNILIRLTFCLIFSIVLDNLTQPGYIWAI